MEFQFSLGASSHRDETQLQIESLRRARALLAACQESGGLGARLDMSNEGFDRKPADTEALARLVDHETPKKVVPLLSRFGTQVFVVEHEKAYGLLRVVDRAKPRFREEVRLCDRLGVGCDEALLRLRDFQSENRFEVLDVDFTEGDVRSLGFDRVASQRTGRSAGQPAAGGGSECPSGMLGFYQVERSARLAVSCNALLGGGPDKGDSRAEAFFRLDRDGF